jgi:3-dehydroquinate dehydratase type I
MKFKLLGESFMRLVRFILGLADDADAQTFAFDGQGFAAPERMSRAQAASRSSISHLLASHGPGPETGMAYVKTLSTLRRAVLPMRANVLSRSSLLTRRTTAMSMTFPDLTMVDPAVFRTITQGVDALEVRVDMLGCMQPASPEERRKNTLKVPELDYEEVARQLETLRQAVPDIPILFTLRSDREGGFFHDDRRLSERDTASPHSQRIYFEMLELAIALGVEMLDVELGWDPWLTKHLISSRGRTRIVPSYHDLAGALRWDSALPQQLYERACSFGNGVHIVMMIGTTQRSTIEQNNHLIAFSARSLSVAAADPRLRLPPLMALNMGMAGRPSRPFNDVLNFVSHPAMPVKAGRGQFTLKEMMEMLVRLSILQVSHFHLYGDLTVQAATAKRVIQAAFNEFGLPYTLLEEGSWTLREYVRTHQRLDIPDRDVEVAEPNSISDGLYIVGQAHRQLELFSEMKNASPQQVSVEAQAVQAIDIIAREDMALSLLGTERGRHAPNSLGEMRGPLVGCHTLPASIKRILKAYLAPINAPNVHRSGLIVILSDKANGVEVDEEVEAETDIAKRSALYALATIGFGTVYVVDEASCLSRSRDALSRRPSLSLVITIAS